MSTEEIQDTLARIINEIVTSVDPTQVTPEKTLAGDLGVDSLAKVEVVYASEEEFGIEIPDSDASALSTVSEFVNYISVKLSGAES